MTTTFSVTRDEVIAGSLRLLGRLAEGASPSAEDITNCSQAMNMLFKAWADQGYKAWLYETLSRTFVANQTSYILGPGSVGGALNRPQRISYAWWEDTQTPVNKQEIFLLAREDFQRLTPKNQPGVSPTNGYYDAALTNGVFYPWPVPDNVNGTLWFTSQRPIEDILANVAVSIPQTWFRALKWGLADEVGLEYRPHPDVLDRIEAKSKLYLQACSNLEEEQASIVFKVSPYPNYGSKGVY